MKPTTPTPGKTRLLHILTGITGTYVRTTKNDKIIIRENTGREYFAPSKEFKLIQS